MKDDQPYQDTGRLNSDFPVGIMADSHGEARRIDRALELFERIGCGKIYHLGDICDSFRMEHSDDCVRLLQKADVIALKGNNDHALVVVQTEAPTEHVAKETIAYLGRLPISARHGNVLFAHSLPFVEELGFSCMIRTPQEAETRWFFSAHPSSFLFRGHSHDPEIRRIKDGAMVAESVSVGQEISLRQEGPSIITCGALIRGLCMVWYPSDDIVTCNAIDAHKPHSGEPYAHSA